MVQLPRWNKAVVRRRSVELLHRFAPVTVWYRYVTPQTLRSDLIGGFIVGVMIVPTALSWASLANISLTCGLTAALVASFSYGTFGQCAALSVGPVAELTTLLISIAAIPADTREVAFQSLGVQVGILAIALSFVDGGKVIKTIFAKAVGDGYTCAAAILAICTQAKVMFNVTAPPQSNIQDVIVSTIAALRAQMTVHSLYCFMLFVLYCGYLVLIKRTRLPLWVPHQLIVVVVSTLLTWLARLDRVLGLAIVGDVPSALHPPYFPPLHNIIELGPYTLTLTMISFVQMYVVAQRVMPDIDPNAELFADGVTNLLVNVFGGMPVTNSFSCSAVLMEQRVHTPLTAYAAGVVVLVTMIGLTRLGVFYFLPKHTLAAIVVASVWRLVDFTGPVHLWRYSRIDAAVWIVTFVLTIFGGITVGVLAGVALSLVLVVLRIARPRAVSVGFSVTTFRYGDLRKDPELLVYPNILMWRFDAPLYFVNMGYFQERLTAALQSEVRPIDVVLVTCGKVVDMDAAALTNMPRILDSIASLDTTSATTSSSSSSGGKVTTRRTAAAAASSPPRQRRIVILTDIHGRLETVLYATAALPIYVPEEHDRLSIAQLEASGKFPVVFRALDDAIVFAQRCISERYGNVDTAPYPNVSFVTDVVVEMAKTQALALQAATAADAAQQRGDDDDANSDERSQQQQQQQSGQVYSDAEGHREEGAAAVAATSTLVTVATDDGDGGDDDAHAATRSRARAGSTSRVTAAAVSSGERRDADAGGNNNNTPLASHTATEKHILLNCLRKLKRLSRFQADRELIGVIGVVRHTELTPKQKRKFVFRDAELLRLAFQPPSAPTAGNSGVDGDGRAAHGTRRPSSSSPSSLLRRPHGRRSVGELAEFFAAAEAALRAGRLRDNAENWQRVLLIVRSRPAGLKIQLKPLYGSRAASFSDTMVLDAQLSAAMRATLPGSGGRVTVSPFHNDNNTTNGGSGLFDVDSGVRAALLVVKWGGVLTHAGIAQASVLGEKLFARFFAAGDLPLHRLLPFTQRPHIVAADEERVVNTALVVMNALTQSDKTLTRGDIVVDDQLVKTLNSTAKRLLHDEYKYYEQLLHIDEHAAARHFFHIPGFRQLLYIPPLDRPLRTMRWHGSRRRRREEGDGNETTTTATTSNNSSDDEEDDGDLHGPSLALLSRQATLAPRSRSGPSGGRGGGAAGAGAASSSAAALVWPTYSLADHDYYTPLQVLRELEANMRVVVETRIARHVVNVPLGNHETLKELRSRYEAMLNNYLGAKRRARRGSDDDDDDNNADNGVGAGRQRRASRAATRVRAPSLSAASNGVHSSPERDGRRSQQQQQQQQEQDSDTASVHSDNNDGDAVSSEASEREGCIIADAAHAQEHDEATTTPTTPAMTAATAAAATAAAAATSDVGDDNLWSPTSTRSAQAMQATDTHAGTMMAMATTTTTAAPRLRADKRNSNNYNNATRRASAPPTTLTSTHGAAPHARRQQQPQQPPRSVYDLSDVSKLRDYAAYDMTYNVPLLRSLFAMTQMHELRHIIDAIERISAITQCMARVGENVLEGVNSSKRFIIGSLVSGALLRRINDDFRDVAAADAARGVLQLLRRAQQLYMAAHGGVEQDVRHVVKLLQRLGMSDRTAASHNDSLFIGGGGGSAAAGVAETDAERRLRRRFPFIALPASCYRVADDDNNKTTSTTTGAADDRGSNNNSSNNSNGSRASTRACTRFYFTSYLHVEGVLHCLFESDTLSGFSRPTKEDLEASLQLYMKHIIFKVFRRRNVSFTDAEVAAAMRRLPLLFDTDVDYARQQRRLHDELTALYHAMYFHSMEVYLSLGDAEASRNCNNSSSGAGGAAGNNNYNSYTGYYDTSADAAGEGEGEAMQPMYTLQERPPSRAAAAAASTATSTAAATASAARLATTRNTTPCEDVRVTHADDDVDVHTATASMRPALLLQQQQQQSRRHVDATSDTLAFSAAPSPVTQQPVLSPRSGSNNSNSITVRALAQQQQQQQQALFDTSIHIFGSNASDRAASYAPTPPAQLLHTAALTNSSSGSGNNGNNADDGAPVGSASAAHVLLSSSPHPQQQPQQQVLQGVASLATSYVSPYDSSTSPHQTHLQQQQQQQQQPQPSASERRRRPVIVLTTPQAGRRTALAQQVKSRVSSVTPMRRIHEGLSLDDFMHLIAEVNSAMRSQVSATSAAAAAASASSSSKTHARERSNGHH